MIEIRQVTARDGTPIRLEYKVRRVARYNHCLGVSSRYTPWEPVEIIIDHNAPLLWSDPQC